MTTTVLATERLLITQMRGASGDDGGGQRTAERSKQAGESRTEGGGEESGKLRQVVECVSGLVDELAE